jgi:hypothetical protein
MFIRCQILYKDTILQCEIHKQLILALRNFPTIGMEHHLDIRQGSAHKNTISQSSRFRLIF